MYTKTYKILYNTVKLSYNVCAGCGQYKKEDACSPVVQMEGRQTLNL